MTIEEMNWEFRKTMTRPDWCLWWLVTLSEQGLKRPPWYIYVKWQISPKIVFLPPFSPSKGPPTPQIPPPDPLSQFMYTLSSVSAKKGYPPLPNFEWSAYEGRKKGVNTGRHSGRGVFFPILGVFSWFWGSFFVIFVNFRDFRVF